MKITLYIRATKPGHVQMFARREEEPNYRDTPRILNLGNEIGDAIDNIIRDCEAAGVVTYCDGRHVKTRGTSAAPDTHKEKA